MDMSSGNSLYFPLIQSIFLKINKKKRKESQLQGQALVKSIETIQVNEKQNEKY